ncbi:MAG: hypothetical protein M1830_005429 [Pleopsidium flavum]|nr:MAG: hypothetical protein M1830_005429 [Pleopsidium flavum]
MSQLPIPRNRKERRAQINTTASSPPSVSFSQPNRSPPAHKTLYEIAAERQSLLQQSQPSPFSPTTITSLLPTSPTTIHTKLNPNGTLTLSPPSPQEPKPDDEDPIGLLGQAIFLASTLTMLHFTLDVLVHHQYRHEISWGEIWRRAGGAWVGTRTSTDIFFADWLLVTPVEQVRDKLTPPLPSFNLVLNLLSYLLHVPSAPSNLTSYTLRPLLHQIIHLTISLLTGLSLLHITTNSSYYAVMKRAPPLGTLWVWSIIELKLTFAVSSLVMVAAVGWVRGYTVF